MNARLKLFWDQLTLRLQDPKALRVSVLAFITVLGLGFIGLPMYHHLTVLNEELRVEKARSGLIKQHQYLSSRMKLYLRRMPKQGNLDWWMNDIINFSRENNIHVAQLTPLPVGNKQHNRIGERQGLFFRIDFQGDFRDTVSFVGQLENAKQSVHLSSLSFMKDTVKAPLSSTLVVDILVKNVKSKSEASNEKESAPVKAEKAAPSDAEGVDAP